MSRNLRLLSVSYAAYHVAGTAALWGVLNTGLWAVLAVYGIIWIAGNILYRKSVNKAIFSNALGRLEFLYLFLYYLLLMGEMLLLFMVFLKNPLLSAGALVCWLIGHAASPAGGAKSKEEHSEQSR